MVAGDGPAASDGAAIRWFAGLVAFLALVQVLCLGTSALGLTFGRGAALATVAAALLGAVLFARRFRQAPAERNGATGERSGAAAPRAVAALAALTLAWVGSVWIRLWILVWRRPPYDWDGLSYHLPAVHEWVRAGRVGWIATHPDMPMVNYPMAVEANGFLVHQLTAETRLIDGWNLWYWPLALLAVVVLAQRLGVGPAWSWLAAGLLAGAPVLVCQSVSCYVDLAFAACVMAAVTASVLLLRASGEAWRHWVLWGASLGLMIGAKGTGAGFALLLAAVVFLTASQQRGRWRWQAVLPALVTALAVALVVGGYWYARNVVRTGNPIHPYEIRLGHKVLADGFDFELLRDNAPAFFGAYPDWLWPAVSWLQLDSPIHGAAPVGGLGYVWLLGGLPATAWIAAGACRESWRRGNLRAEPELMLLVLLCLLLFLAQPAAWWSRFTVWLHIVGLPCLALALQRGLSRRRTALRAAVLAWLVTLTGVAVTEAERTLSIEWRTGRQDLDGETRMSYATTLDRLFPGIATSDGFDRLLAADRIARSRWGYEGTRLGGALALPLGRREINFLRPEALEDELLRLRQDGVRWVLWDVSGAGQVPESLRQLALEEHGYPPSADLDYLAFLMPPAPGG